MSSVAVMSCTEYQDLAALLAMDVLEPEARPAVAAHVATCPACSGVMADLVVATGALAYAAPARSPRPQLKDRLMGGLDRTPLAAVPVPARPAARKPRNWAVVAAAVLGVGLAAASMRLGQQYEQVAQLNAQQAALSDELARMSQEQALARQDAEMLAGKDVRMVAMQTQPMASSAQAWVYWSPTRRAWLATFRGLPEAGPNKTYQLWAVTEQKKVSLGTFATDEHGVARVRAELPPNGKPMAAAVTLEPAGGMPDPTGPMVMVGPIKQL
jgi:type II secretory pathway pseudopilin PulG